MVLSFLASVPSPVVFFGCFLVVLTFLGAFALRLAGFEEDSEFYEEVGPDGKVRVAFQFPPHETREERRRRSARALRRRFWPGLAPGPEAGALDADAEREVNHFVQALLATAKGGKAPPVPTPEQPQQLWSNFDPEYEVLMYCEAAPEKPGTLSTPEATLSPAEAKKIRKKIFSVVMNAGPPKSLPPITEEDLLALEQVVDLEAGSPGAGHVLLGRSTMPPEVSSAWQMVGRARGKEATAWAEFDSEPIMTVGKVTATRSVLWASLRKLEELESRAVQW